MFVLSFGNTIYKQIDGMAMGSLLVQSNGPVLADIDVGYHDSLMYTLCYTVIQTVSDHFAYTATRLRQTLAMRSFDITSLFSKMLHFFTND